VRSYLRKQLSQYEGEKRLDQMNTRLAVGDLSRVVNPVTKQAPKFGGDSSAVDRTGTWLCDVCRVWKRSFKLVRVRTSGYQGARVHNMKGRYIRACAGCAAAIEGGS
jgi:hypothetical protein